MITMVNGNGNGYPVNGFYSNPYKGSSPNSMVSGQIFQTVPSNEFESLLDPQYQQMQQQNQIHQQYIYQQQQHQQHQQQQYYYQNWSPQQQHQQLSPTSSFSISSPQMLQQQQQQQQGNSKKRYLDQQPTSPNSSSAYYQQFNFIPISQPPSPQPHSLSPSSTAINLLGQPQLLSSSPTNISQNGSGGGPSDGILDEDVDEQLKEYFQPIINQNLDQSCREHILNLLTDFSNEEIPLKNIFLELRDIQMEDKSLLQYLIEIFLVLDTSPKMFTYLRDNGISDQELNSTVESKNFTTLLTDFENALKKRERGRKSVSRGLRNPPNKWTKEESQRLIQLVHDNGDKQWKKIALQIGGGKTGAQCAQHWKRVLCPAIRKGSWDEEEEAKLFILVEKHGQSWKNVASEIRTRTDIQCRYQYFKSCMSREVPWSSKEDELLQKKVIESKQEGRDLSWMDISKSMARARQTKIPRTALECKSRWENISMGSIIDGLDTTISSNF
ncbi:putative myb transcription factor [Tieghemostelium lacteum]|uniref:Putative myb transcription factor n=1 Tax=Tieghemostelium lacteum TaxID=361077 RepID=A0A151ZGI5_TIELA|nr:putative myb transcription factor [Tieghemostelium lacteum]|eukprot:KYQ93082.1 putative myb transcription factor [Tieghemostelium lacteum]